MSSLAWALVLISVACFFFVVGCIFGSGPRIAAKRDWEAIEEQINDAIADCGRRRLDAVRSRLVTLQGFVRKKIIESDKDDWPDNFEMGAG